MPSEHERQVALGQTGQLHPSGAMLSKLIDQGLTSSEKGAAGSQVQAMAHKSKHVCIIQQTLDRWHAQYRQDEREACRQSMQVQGGILSIEAGASIAKNRP